MHRHRLSRRSPKGLIATLVVVVALGWLAIAGCCAALAASAVRFDAMVSGVFADCASGGTDDACAAALGVRHEKALADARELADRFEARFGRFESLRVHEVCISGERGEIRGVARFEDGDAGFTATFRRVEGDWALATLGDTDSSPTECLDH